MNAFLWLLKREVWESRSVWLVPSICALVMIVAAVFGTSGISHIDVNDAGPDHVRLADFAGEMGADKLSVLTSIALTSLLQPFLFAALLTQAFYSLASLYTERQDRSILFWKSLPPDDARTVLSKLCTAAFVIPLAALAIGLVTEIVIVIAASIHLRAVPEVTQALWSFSAWGQSLGVTFYLWLIVMIWSLPFIGFNLLVSAATPRSPVMVSTLLLVGTWYVDAKLLGLHLLHAATTSWMRLLVDGFGQHGEGATSLIINHGTVEVPRSLAEIARPLAFFGSPVLWVGLAFTGGLVAAAIWVRRYRAAAATG